MQTYTQIYIHIYVCTGCASLNPTMHKWHTQVCCAISHDTRTYTLDDWMADMGTQYYRLASRNPFFSEPVREYVCTVPSAPYIYTYTQYIDQWWTSVWSPMRLYENSGKSAVIFTVFAFHACLMFRENINTNDESRYMCVVKLGHVCKTLCRIKQNCSKPVLP